MSDDQLSQMLKDGWGIDGYSTTIMAAGAMTHSILLKKGERLECVTIVVNMGKEIGRQFYKFAPASPAPQKSGWFG